MRILKMLCALVFVGGCATTPLFSPIPQGGHGSTPSTRLVDPVWVDGDFGCGKNSALISDVDDCAALLLLKRSGIRVLGISTTGGNVSERESFVAAKLVAGNIPIYRGKNDSCSSPAVLGFKKETEKERVVLFALAPLSNVATLLRCGLSSRIKRIVFVGGRLKNEAFVLNPEYTSIPLSDMNVRKNPTAVREVLGFDIPMTLVPFESGKRIQISMGLLSAWGVNIPAQTVKKFVQWDWFMRQVFGTSGMPLWDMHAVAAELWPHLFLCEKQPAELKEDNLFVGESGRKITHCLPKDPERLRQTELRTLKN